MSEQPEIDDPCAVVRIQEEVLIDGPGDGWTVICCEQHDPLASAWDSAEAAKAALSKRLGISLDDWWFEDDQWMAEARLGGGQ